MQPYEVFYLSENGVITADSIPDLDDWNLGFLWGYDDTWWTCSDWVAWHKANENKYGLAIANQKFKEYWNKQTMGAGAVSCRSVNTEFRKYVKSKAGLADIVWQSAGAVGLILKPVGAGVDIGTDIGKGLGIGAKILKWAIPVAVIGGLTYGGVKLYQAAKKK